jgi:hypothetical protein
MLGRADEFSGSGQPSTNFTAVGAANPSLTDASGFATDISDAQITAPTAAPFVFASQQSMLSVAQPTVLSDGTYKILDSSVQDGMVELTLQSKDTGESIRVSLPLEQLLGSGNDAVAFNRLVGDLNARVNLAGQSSELATWFEKLNLSEVKVETLPQSQQNDNPVKLTLSGAATVANSALQISLPKSEIKAFRISNLGQRLNKTNSNNGGSGNPVEFGVPSVIPVAKGIRVVPRMMSADESLLSRGTFEEFTKSVDGQTTMSDSKTLTPSFSQELRLSATPTGDRVEFGSVRFTLPDKIEQSLLPGGKSVMLKIHPEHLGPARLNLNWGSDGLSARVTVDSPLAQTAIERSLDKLQEQLSQAGIKVDHIGVSLSGGHTRGQFAQGQPQWQRQSSNHFYHHNEYRAAEYVSAIASTPLGMAQYVGSQGVNLFA